LFGFIKYIYDLDLDDWLSITTIDEGNKWQI